MLGRCFSLWRELMLKKSSVILCCASALLIGSVCAQSVNAPFIYTFNIPAQGSFNFSNSIFELSGLCTVSMEPNQSTSMTGTVLRPTITLDGVSYATPNSSVSRIVHNGDSFTLTASAFSYCNLKNEGQYEITAKCVLRDPA
jgi:hypothetical protein